MSSKTCVPEMEPRGLDQFVAEHPDCALFVMGAYDLRFDPLIEALVADLADKTSTVAVAWMCKTQAPKRIGCHCVRGGHNIFVFKGGIVVKRMMGIPPIDCLKSVVAEALSGKKPEPPPER